MTGIPKEPSGYQRRRVGWIVGFSFVLIFVMVAAVVLSGLVINPFAARALAPVATASPTATLIPTATPFVPQQAAPALLAQAAIMIDPTTGNVLYSLHANDVHAMASTTKIMTALVTILTTTNLEQQVTVGTDVNQLAGTGAVTMGSIPGQVYSLHDLLYGLLLPSADDAAIVLADGVAGSQSAFVARMNQVATWLGLTHTHFVNPHGLDTDSVIGDGNYTTATDLATLAQFAMQFPSFRQIVATSSYAIPATTTHPQVHFNSTDEFLSKADSVAGNNFTDTGSQWGVDGVKTGYTGNAGHCLVIDARHAGHTVVLVLLDEPSHGITGDVHSEQRFIDGAALLNWIFTQEPAV